jgi:hypothetical protein
MQDSFNFNPPVAAMVTTDRLLFPMKVVRTALAGAALRSYIRLSHNSGEYLPGLKLGRIHLPLDILLTHNNIHKDVVGETIPHQVIEAEIKQRKCLLILFSDRTALIAREENDCLDHASRKLFRVLPIVLKLSSRVRMLHRPVEYGISVSATKETSVINITSKEYANFSFMHGPYPNQAVFNDMCILQGQFHDEIEAWSEEIDRGPLVALPEVKRTSGIFGQDCEAPDPSLTGLPWVRPAALQYIGFTKEQFEKAQRFCHLAFLHILEKNAERLAGGDFVACVNTAELSQDGTTTSASIEILAWTQREPVKKLQSELREEYKSLLKHEKAPGFLFDLVGHATTEKEKGIALTRNHPWTIYLGDKKTPGSRHDQLAAYALFAR